MSDISEQETPRGERGVACTYSSCQHRFPSLKAMQAHKVEDPEHFYCKKCDVDCEDWEDLTKHKVDKMAPYIEKRIRVKDEKPVHIVCEFCGEGFKSFDGRKLHRASLHPAEQDIDCPGCQRKFIRATHMIEHLERNECKGIPSWMLYASINHKYIVNQVMEAPDKFQRALLACKPKAENYDLCQRELTDGSEAADQEEGGVSLLDKEDNALMAGYGSMKPTKGLTETHPRRKISPQELFPKLPQESRDIVEGVQTLGLGSATTSRRGNMKTKTSSPTSDLAIVKENSSQPANAWLTNNASKALFPYAKPTPLTGGWQTMGQDLGLEKDCRNIMASHFWNPDDPNYSAKRFYSNVVEAYICPMPVCEHDTKSYTTLGELQEHICDMHYLKMFRCEVCFKRFNKVAALMGHVEHTTSCRVKESKSFEKFIAQMTGGFLTAESVSQPKVFRFDQSMIKAGTAVGVQPMKFSGALPGGI